MSDSDDFSDPDVVYDPPPVINDQTHVPNIDKYLDESSSEPDNYPSNPNHHNNNNMGTISTHNHNGLDDMDDMVSDEPPMHNHKVRENVPPIRYDPKPPSESRSSITNPPTQNNVSSSQNNNNNNNIEDNNIPLYNPNDFLNLNVSREIEHVFEYITQYIPQSLKLETKLLPFIPDYIPAIGEPDSFVKIPRPDDKESVLGLTILDEPNILQSDPATLELQLRHTTKEARLKAVNIRSIDNAQNHPNKITAWIENISTVHRQKPPPTVEYKNSMPPMEDLMEAWSPAMEKFLDLNIDSLPNPNIDLNLEEYIKLCLSLVGIPCRNNINNNDKNDKSIIESLHMFTTLYINCKKHLASKSEP